MKVDKCELSQVPKASAYNRDAIKATDVCGCYFCLQTFPSRDVREWTDSGRTAICPHCSIDSVLAGVVDAGFLAAAHEMYFCSDEGDMV